MQDFFGKTYRIVPRGASGLACDEAGIALGPISLVKKCTQSNQYEILNDRDLAETLVEVYGAISIEKFEAIKGGLRAVMRALEKQNLALASIAAVHLGLDEFGIEGYRRLAKLATLHKYNPDEPRVPAGNPDGGQWTSNGASPEPEKEHPAQTAQAIPFPPSLIPIPGIPNPYNVPNIPFPNLHLPQFFEPTPTNPYPDRPECAEEWAAAYEFCWAQMQNGKLKPAPPGRGKPGFGKDFNRCILGQVSADCGGNQAG
jgi:hypothetical protein